MKLTVGKYNIPIKLLSYKGNETVRKTNIAIWVKLEL